MEYNWHNRQKKKAIEMNDNITWHSYFKKTPRGGRRMARRRSTKVAVCLSIFLGFLLQDSINRENWELWIVNWEWVRDLKWWCFRICRTVFCIYRQSRNCRYHTPRVYSSFAHQVLTRLSKVGLTPCMLSVTLTRILLI